MSTTNPKRSSLERLEIDKKSNRHGYGQSSRSWSADSGKDIHGIGLKHHGRKSTSPKHLPRLQTPPEWPRQYQHDGDLKRGKLNVIPPVKITKQAFVSQSFPRKAKQKELVHPKQSYHAQQQGNMWNTMSGVPVVAPSLYGLPVQNGSFMATSNASLPYPPGAYPVPVYMSYAPMLLPPIQNLTGYPLGVIPSHLNQRVLTRDQAATCIQKYFRGWKARKGSKFCQLQFLSHFPSAKHFIEDLISELLEEEIIPDILIEVLSHIKPLSPHDPLHKMSNNICSDILHEDVSVFLNEIAASVFYPQVNLNSLRRTDPLFQVGQEIVNEVVIEVALSTVHSTIKSLVDSHMTFSRSTDWMENFISDTIQPMIRNVAAMTLKGFKYEMILEEIIDEVTTDLAQPVIVEAWKDVIDTHRSKQITKIGSFSEGRLLDSLFLEHLLSHLAGNNLSLYLRDYIEQTMDGLICGVLLNQYMLVDDAGQDTLTNKTLQKYHQESFTDMVLDVILDELCAHLDEDMQDLLEKEKLDACTEKIT